MKILVLVSHDIALDNGTTIRAKRIYELLRHQFHVVLKGYRGFRGSLFRKTSLWLIPCWLFSLVYTIVKGRFDVIYLSHDRYGFLVVKILQPLFRYKIIYEAHAIVSEEYAQRNKPVASIKMMYYLERFVTRHSDCVTALSENILEFFRKHTPRVVLIPGFVDTDYYRLDSKAREEIRSKYQVSGVLVGLVGSFTAVFNRHYLSFLYDNLSAFDERIKFLIIGNCPWKVQSPRLIYTGYIDNYPGYLSCPDCLLIPASIPTSGPLNKILEAMSSGIPVFTTPQGMVGLYYVRPGKDIFVFQEAELVAKLNQLVFNKELMLKTARNARAVVTRYYSAAAVREKLVSVINSTAAAGQHDNAR